MSSGDSTAHGHPIGGNAAHPTGRVPWATAIVVPLLGLCLLAAGGSIGLDVAGPPGSVTWGSASVLLAFVAFSAVGALVALKRPANVMGRIFVAIGLLGALGGLTESYVRYAAPDPGDASPLELASAWFQSWYWFPLLALVMIFVPLYFPTGEPPTVRWRWVARLGGGSAAVFTALSALQPTLAVRDTDVVLPNPLAVPGVGDPEETMPGSILGMIVLMCVLAACASVLVRFRRSTGDERLQLKWFTFAAALIPLGILMDLLLPDSLAQTDALFGITIAALPVACGVAVLKYRLYDIEVVINRTLVYVALSATVVALYVGVVAMFDSLLRRTGLGVSLVATALVAVFFQPARERLQNGVDRLMYGERRDPYRVLSRLGKELESVPAVEQMLPSFTGTVADALRLPFVAIELRQEGGSTLLGAHGDPAVQKVAIPVLYHGEVLGDLVVGRRSPGERFSDADTKLLEDLARQAGSAVNAVRLNSQLQAARQQLVTSREEERRRLRRDLHDGLGPALAGIGLQVEAARNLLRRDPDLAEEAIGDLGSKIEEAVSEIRRLVYGLRPPALDELGLAGALREQAHRTALGQAVKVESTGDLASLPAAVEVAAYRIASEALTNAARHSQASQCSIGLVRTGDALEVEIIDDGKGLKPGGATGVGLHSIRERAAELGGTCSIGEAAGGGTRVWARLPLPG